MIETYFHELGFNSSETKVYLALAELGKSTASLLSKRIRIPRTTAYSVLDNLVKKGVVALEQRGSSTFYSVNGPGALLRMLEEEKQQLAVRERTATVLVDLIKPYFKSKNFSIPKIQFYEGQENVESMLYDHTELWQEEVLRHDGTWWGYQDHTFVEHYIGWLKHYWAMKKPEERIQLISNNAPVEQGLAGRVEGREIRQVTDEIDFSSTIWVLGECIVLIMTRQAPHYAFQIRDAVFADNLRGIFRLLWRITEPKDLAN